MNQKAHTLLIVKKKNEKAITPEGLHQKYNFFYPQISFSRETNVVFIKYRFDINKILRNQNSCCCCCAFDKVLLAIFFIVMTYFDNSL